MLKIGQPAPEFEFETAAGSRVSFPRDFKGKWLALYFLRYLGCPLCLEKLNELIADQQKYAERGIELFAVVQSTENRVKDYSRKKGVKFHLISDRPCQLYQRYQVAKGGISALLAPQVALASMRATLKGNFHGPFEGEELQKPAVFIIDPAGNLAFLEYGKNIAAMMNNGRLFQLVGELKQERGK